MATTNTPPDTEPDLPTSPPPPGGWRAIWLVPDMTAPPCPHCGSPKGVYKVVGGVLARLAQALIVKGQAWNLAAELAGEGRVAVRVATDGEYIRVRREVDEDPIRLDEGERSARRHRR